MDNYIRLLQDHRVSHLVCATDQLYRTDELTKNGKNVNTPITFQVILLLCRQKWKINSYLKSCFNVLML